MYAGKLRIKVQYLTTLGYAVRYSPSNNYQLIKASFIQGKYELESTIKISTHDKIGNTQSFTDEISMIKQVSIKVLHDPLDYDFCRIDGFLVVWFRSTSRTEPCSQLRKDFVVCKGTPLNYLGVRFRVLGNKSCIRILFSN